MSSAKKGSSLNLEKILKTIFTVIVFIVGYVERLIRNCFSQTKWTFETTKWLHTEFIGLYTTTPPRVAVKISVITAIVIFGICLLLTLLFLMVFKSIAK